MALKQLTDDEALALSDTTDPATGLQYPRLLSARWAEAILRALNRFLDVAAPDLRVLEVEGNADAVAVLAGRATIAGTMYAYAGETGDNGAVDGLADNTTHLIYAHVDGGELAIASATEGEDWPAEPHLKLAVVVMAGGEVTSVQDVRGAQMLSSAASVAPAAAVADIADPGNATAEDVADKVNELLASLRTAGLLAE